MFTKFSKKFLAILLSVMLIMAAVPMGMVASAAKTVTVLDGQVSVTDSVGNGSVLNGTVTVQAKGGLFSQTTNNITITNETTDKAMLSFSYSASNYSSFSESSASGTYSATLEGGASVSFSIKGKAGLSNTTASLTFSNFSLVAAAEASDVTFVYDNAYGSVTVDGSAVSSGDVKVLPLTGAALVATPVSGAKFLGWVDDANGVLLSTNASYTITPATAMTVKAVFIGENSAPHFMIGATTQKPFKYGLLSMQTGYYWTVSSGTHLFDNLTDAAAASSASMTSKGIVLMNDGTLPAGDYTIPSGSTLLIPFDDANTLYKTEAECKPYDDSTYKTHVAPAIYRKLTMASGANIIVNGEMSLSSKHVVANGGKTSGGSPVDFTCIVDMESNSSITVNSKGSLYVYGFITGEGSVTAKNGSTVFENFQLTDFRGGTQSTSMENGVFPMSQYYVQNIEVPLKLESGATEKSYTTLYMQSSKMSSSVGFIGPSGCMFNLTSGYVIKEYDGSKDRLNIELSGTMTVSPISMKVGTSTLDSDEYELPVTNNITLTAKSGSSVSIGQDIAMLPGSEIIIEEGAKCTVGSGINIYIYDADEWGNFTGAGAALNKPFQPLVYAPGRTYNRTLADIVDAKIQIDGEIDALNGYVYTTAGGAEVISSGTGKVIVSAGTQTITHQLVHGVGYTEIPLTPVKLKNADGTFVNSATDTYEYVGENWRCTNHNFETVTTPPTCATAGSIVKTCTACGYIVTEAGEPATGQHNYESVVTEPTCSSEGYTTHTCTTCGDSYTDSTVEPLDHTYESTVTPPTCSEQGYTTYVCSVCSHTYVDDIVDPSHKYTATVTAPTCTEKGYTTHKCSACGDTYTDSEVAALGHSYNTEVTAPTCTEQGYTTYTCSVCGDTYKDDYVEATGHSFGDWQVRIEADCNNAGEEYRVCECGEEETNIIPAKGHDLNAVVTAPTCTEQGYTTYTCTVCGHSYNSDYVDALGHSYNTEVTAPTCTEKGYTTYTCSVCGDTYKDNYVDAAGHSYNMEVTAPTCTEKGYTTYTCSACGDTYKDNYVDALGHSFGDWIVDTDADCENAGSKHKECSVCSATETEVISALGHSYQEEFTVDKEATHSEEGSKSKHCSVCSAKHEITVIPMIICDYDADGKTDGVELAMMRKFLTEIETPNAETKVLFDMDDNGAITLVDLVKLKKYIVNK